MHGWRFNALYMTSYLALVIYDWLINLDEEFRCFWTSRKGRVQPVAALLYIISRYLSIVIEVLEAQTVVPLSDIVRAILGPGTLP